MFTEFVLISYVKPEERKTLNKKCLLNKGFTKPISLNQQNKGYSQAREPKKIFKEHGFSLPEPTVRFYIFYSFKNYVHH